MRRRWVVQVQTGNGSAMTLAHDQLPALLERTALRLRSVQNDFAHHPLSLQQSYLDEEIRRALIDLAEEDRPGFLQQLQSQFPDYQPPPTTDVSPGLLLLDRLIDLIPALSLDEQQALADRMRELIGLPPAALEAAGPGVTTAEPALPDGLANTLRGKLGLGPEDPLSPAAVAEMAAILVDFAGSLYQLTWQTWKTLSPESQLRRAGNLQTLLGQYAAGGGEMSKEHLAGELAKLRQLIAALISAVSQVGQQFASSYLSKFSPNEIEMATAAEHARVFSNKQALCWRKYLELAEALNEQAIEADIRQVVAGYTEHLMKGLGH